MRWQSYRRICKSEDQTVVTYYVQLAIVYVMVDVYLQCRDASMVGLLVIVVLPLEDSAPPATSVTLTWGVKQGYAVLHVGYSCIAKKVKLMLWPQRTLCNWCKWSNFRSITLVYIQMYSQNYIKQDYMCIHIHMVFIGAYRCIYNYISRCIKVYTGVYAGKHLHRYALMCLQAYTCVRYTFNIKLIQQRE